LEERIEATARSHREEPTGSELGIAANIPDSGPTLSTRNSALILILSWKAASFLVLFLAVSLLQVDSRFPGTERITLGEGFDLLWTALSNTWDANHYIYLAEHGYARDLNWNAFFPLYPMLMRLLNLITSNSLISGLLISNLASIAGLYMFYLFVRDLRGERVALSSLILLVAFPTAFFLNLVYSEGLFFFLMMAFFYLLYQRRYGLAAFPAFLLPFTRPIGVICFVPFVLFVLTDAGRSAGLFSRPFSSDRLMTTAAAAPWHYTLAPLSGLLGYFAFMYLAAGDPFAAFEAQKNFVGTRSLEHLWDPVHFVRVLVANNLVIHDYTRSWLDRLFFLGFLLSLPFVYRRVDKGLFAFYLLMGLEPLSGSFLSYMRYGLMAFPLFIACAVYLEEKNAYGGVFAVAMPLLLVQALFAGMHISTYWVG
jgi:hypothetical protein